MATTTDTVPDIAGTMLEAWSASGALESELRGTPRWRYRRRAELLRALEGSRRRERQALHLLGVDVPWPYEYWPSP